MIDAKEMVKKISDDGECEINGRIYKFHKMTHKQRRKVFAFFTKVQGMIATADLSFIDTPEYDEVEAVMFSSISCEDSILSKAGDAHFEKFSGDYIKLISTALGVISYPFMDANPTS